MRKWKKVTETGIGLSQWRMKNNWENFALERVEVSLLLCSRSQGIASEIRLVKNKPKNTEFSLVFCTRSDARYLFGKIQKYNNNKTWFLTILSSSSPFYLLSSTSTAFQFSFQSGIFKIKKKNDNNNQKYNKTRAQKCILVPLAMCLKQQITRTYAHVMYGV